jgi:hypothetical protein
MKRAAALLWCMISLSAASISAQQDTTETRPFVEGGVFDKPYLARLLGRTAIGGYVEAHTRHEREDGAGETTLELKRFNLFASAQVSDFVRFGAELEFEEGGEEVKVEYAAIDLGIHEALNFRAGMILSPLGRFNLSHDSPLNEFTDRPLVSTDVLGVALSEPGMGGFGTFDLAGTSRITYEAYAVNGFSDGVIANSPGGTSIPLGRQNLEDQNSSPAFVGRTTYSPQVGWEFGASVHHGAYNVFNLDGVEIDERRGITIWVIDVEAEPLGFRVTGEAALASINVSPNFEGIYASGQSGFYLDVLRDFGRGWVPIMPASYFSAGARLDMVDFDRDLTGDSFKQITLALNFRPTEETVVKFNYIRGKGFDRFNNRGDTAGILLSVASYF